MGKEIALIEVGGVGDRLTATIDYGDLLCIECDEPWAGDTETGFGNSSAVRLTKEQGKELAAFILDWANK